MHISNFFVSVCLCIYLVVQLVGWLYFVVFFAGLEITETSSFMPN